MSLFRLVRSPLRSVAPSFPRVFVPSPRRSSVVPSFPRAFVNSFSRAFAPSPRRSSVALSFISRPVVPSFPRAFVPSLSFDGHVLSVRMMGQSLAGIRSRTVFTLVLTTPGGVVPPYPGLFTDCPFRAKNNRRTLLFIQSVIRIGQYN